MHAEAPNVIEIDPAESRLKRMRRSVLTSSRLLRDEVRPGFRPGKWAMLTLTYRPDSEWDRRHVSQLLHSIRQYLKRKGHQLRYVWVMELHKSGKPHYHIGLCLPRGITLPMPDKRGWWGHGSTRIEWAKHVIGYMAKYLSKGSAEDRLPKGARISGTGGLSEESRREKRWWLSPRDLREAMGPCGNPFRAPGGGWIDRASGELFPATWAVVAVGRRSIRLIRRVDLEPIRQGLMSLHQGLLQACVARAAIRR